MKLYLLLDNVRSMENIGSIFRTADAAGVGKLFLCGITPKPPRKEIDKAALGAVDFVDWEYYENIKDLILKFKKNGATIITLEQDPRSIPYNQLDATSRIQNSDSIAVIVGNEVDGISEEVLHLADIIAEIPMYGKKNSLNVAVSTGIMLYEIIKNRIKKSPAPRSKE